MCALNADGKSQTTVATQSRTRHGFRCGPCRVDLATSDPKFGVIVTVWTGKKKVDIRVTPSGLIRVGDVERDWHKIDDVDHAE